MHTFDKNTQYPVTARHVLSICPLKHCSIWSSERYWRLKCIPDEVVVAVPNKPVGFDVAPKPVVPKPVVPKPVEEVFVVPKPPNKPVDVVFAAFPKPPNRLLEADDVVPDPKDPKPVQKN